jgi:phosphomannomutase
MAGSEQLIVSVSGVRGIVGQGLSPLVALRYASALGDYLQGGAVVLGRDGRPSGEMLRHAVLAGLSAAGCHVHDLGVVPTPTLGLAVRTLGAAGGIQITASHNPPPWNGLKLFGSDGRILPARQGQHVQERFDAGTTRPCSWEELGKVQAYSRAGADHRDRILELIEVDAIRAAGLSAFLDANGGAGGPLGRDLLEALGVKVIGQGCAADGNFLHEPEPIEANLRDVAPRVASAGAHLGFVLDPDADRLALIDEMGRYIGEELTLALATWFRLQQQPGPVVINLSTSRVVEDIAQQAGCVCHRSAVGEANVADRMLEVDAVIGGEGNGGVIDPRVGLVRDPFIGMSLILNLMAHTGKSLRQLVAELPTYQIVKDKYTVSRDKLPELFRTLESRWPHANADHQDGLRLSWADRWVHIRPSNTEPVVRVIAEAPRSGDAEELCHNVGQMLCG